VPGVDYKAFQVPVAIIFAVTGVSRASVLVLDVQRGYLDKMLVTPVRRSTLLLGMMVADVVLVLFLSALVVGMGLAVGVRFETGLLGLLVFLAISSAWGMAFTGIPYTVALRTGNPAAVNTSFLLFFPFLFLTSAFVPREVMTGWLGAVAGWNPVTYLLDGLRSLISEGWEPADIAGAVAAAVGISVITFTMAFTALRNRVSGPD
jgi:ABC-2 type transport system permease protein